MTPHRGEHWRRCFGEEFRSPSVAGSPVPFAALTASPDLGLGRVDENHFGLPLGDEYELAEDEAAAAAGLTAAYAAAEALSPLQPMPRRALEVDVVKISNSRPGTPLDSVTAPSSDLTPVRPTPVRPNLDVAQQKGERAFSYEKAPGNVTESSFGIPLMNTMGDRPPTASTRPSTANASSEATPSRLGSLSPEVAYASRLDLQQVRSLYPTAAYPGLVMDPDALDAIGLPPFPAGTAAALSGLLAANAGSIGAERGSPAPGHFDPSNFGFPRPMTTPPDFLRVESPPPNVVQSQSDREQIYNDLKGRVVEFSKSQVGSRYLQRQLRKETPELVALIVMEVITALPELMCDTYGNYLCQQLFVACSSPLRLQILERLMPCAREISCDRRGTHALQALMGVAMTKDERMVVQLGLQRRVGDTPLVVQLAFDAHGTHVVQRILVCFDPSSSEFIYNSTLPLLDQLAQHPYGLCVVKKCIAQASDPQKQRIIKKLAAHATDLVVSPYGNYAIQAALEAWGGVACRAIILKLRGRILHLAVQKFSSNVVEKCIAAVEPQLRNQLIDELIGPDRSGLHVLMESQYGMYAIQKAIHHATPKQLHEMRQGIQRHVGGLHNRKMRSKWEKLLTQLQAMPEKSTAAAVANGGMALSGF
jgi:hypothetical protein